MTVLKLNGDPKRRQRPSEKSGFELFLEGFLGFVYDVLILWR